MKVTIITPTFNSAKTLSHNLNSVARQSYKNIEHIIVDNCSTDGRHVLAHQHDHIAQIISEKDKDIYDAINKGIADGSGRLQTVDETVSPRYYNLINSFREKTGVPILLNTSFNENEPIVNTPQEALDCYLRTSMDMLVLENCVIQRV
jgi:predicted NodU family carbamoyl transferase